MTSVRVLLCDLCIILFFVLSIVLAQESQSTPVDTDDGLKGNCSCGGFPTTTPAADSSPVLSQTPGLVVKCEEEGEITCKTLCTALATATKAKGPQVLCNKLNNADELKLSAFYKICNKPWVYANMTAEEPLCCDDAKVKVCASVEKANSTVATESKTVI